MVNDAASQIVFLGWAERASLVSDMGTPLLKWNVLGLKPVLLTIFFPFRLNGLVMGFAIRNPGDITLDLRIKTVDQTKEVGFVKIGMVSTDDPPPAIRESHELTMMNVLRNGWMPAFFPLDKSPIFIPEAGQYVIAQRNPDSTEEIVGEFHVGLVEPAPLTPERVAAIKSDPNAAKAVRAELSCTKCPSILKVYAALDRIPDQEAKGFVWYQSIPDQFNCQCGSTKLNVSTMKRNFFALLGHHLQSGDEVRYEPRYEENALNNLRIEFIKLLDSTPSEETLQKFIEQNPILLHQFPAEKLFVKPPILTFFNADFAIVTPQKELVLIEIEKAQTRLLRKDGGEAAELRHAFDQATNWLHVVNEHFLAVLDSLKIERNSVSTVYAVVIAGRDSNCDAAHLRRLKGVDRGRVRLLTYDDLAFGLAAVIRRMERL